MRGSQKIRFAAVPMLVAIAAIAAGCSSGGGDAATSTTPSTSAATTAASTTASASPSTTTVTVSPSAERPAPGSTAPAAQNQGSNHDASVPHALMQVGAPCPRINNVGYDGNINADLVCEAGPNGQFWAEAPAVKVRAIGEDCEPKLESVAWSTAGVELMCVDRAWIVAG